MAEHDYVIANQNGANTRSDLNNALAAIVSNNSKASAPTTTYAYMWWADTANDILKQRNGADSAWISILTLSTGAPLGALAASLVSGTHTNFTSTGIDDNATSTAITIDANENVGIGAAPDTSPSTKLHIREDDAVDYKSRAVVQSSDQRLIAGSHWQSGVTAYSYLQATNDAETSPNNLLLNPDGGNVSVGTTTNPGYKLMLVGTGTVQYINRTGSDGSAITFANDGVHVGSITVSGSNTAFNTSSDYRLKENVVPMSGSIDRLKALKPSRFNFIKEPLETVDGFLAHEAQAVVPECVSGVKDDMIDIGNITDVNGEITQTDVKKQSDLETGKTWTKTGSIPEYQGIDQSKLVPLLVASLQEAVAKIEALEARVTALEV